MTTVLIVRDGLGRLEYRRSDDVPPGAVPVVAVGRVAAYLVGYWPESVSALFVAGLRAAATVAAVAAR